MVRERLSGRRNAGESAPGGDAHGASCLQGARRLSARAAAGAGSAEAARGGAGSPGGRLAPAGRSSALSPCPESPGRERACGRPRSRGQPGAACRSTCLPSTLAPAGWHSSRRGRGGRGGRGGAGSPRQRRAVAWGGAERIPSVRGWVSPGSAGSFLLPGPPRRASALLGAPAAWRRLGTGFGLPDPAASPGWPFQTSLKPCAHAVSSSFVKWV